MHVRNEYLRAVLDSLGVGIMACDPQGRLVEFNDLARLWHGLEADPELAPDSLPEHFSLFEPDGVTPLTSERNPMLRALREGRVSGAEVVIAPRNGARTRVLVQGRSLVDETGATAGAVVAMHDITAQRRLEDDLQFRAFHDELTGLANRALLADRIDFTLAQRISGSDRGVAVLMLDIDDFKVVNDTHGHEYGDLLLVEVAAMLLATCRDGDTVARLGGDEFALLLPDSDLNEALHVAERIAAGLLRPQSVLGLEIVVSASVGIVVSDGQGRSALLREADIAMYAAKAAGGAGSAVYQSELYEDVLARYQLELDLRGAAERGELVLEYQPVLHLGRHEMVAVEALLRWEHPVHGRIPPLSFIPIAEDGGSIRQIGDWVLETACRQLLRWDLDHPLSALGLAVNLSPRQLLDTDLVRRVARVLARVGVDPARITLEVTETAFRGDIEQMILKLHQLKDLGVRLAIDDFGTGFSSLSFLRRLPVDVLKVDKSFVSGIAREPEEWALTTAIIKLAASLGKQTLAEGIELGEQLAHLRTLNCELGQGYLFDRPLHPEIIGDRLAAAALR